MPSASPGTGCRQPLVALGPTAGRREADVGAAAAGGWVDTRPPGPARSGNLRRGVRGLQRAAPTQYRGHAPGPAGKPLAAVGHAGPVRRPCPDCRVGPRRLPAEARRPADRPPDSTPARLLAPAPGLGDAAHGSLRRGRPTAAAHGDGRALAPPPARGMAAEPDMDVLVGPRRRFAEGLGR